MFLNGFRQMPNGFMEFSLTEKIIKTNDSTDDIGSKFRLITIEI